MMHLNLMRNTPRCAVRDGLVRVCIPVGAKHGHYFIVEFVRSEMTYVNPPHTAKTARIRSHS